jgi:hypothetical protein
MNAAPLGKVAKWIDAYRRQWDAKFEVLDNLLAQMQTTPINHET